LNRVLVTGATGMVGRQVTARLRESAIGVIATARTRPTALADGVTWTACDLAETRTPQDFEAAFGAVDAIVHCAALIPGPGAAPDARAMFDVNVGATLQLAMWAQAADAAFVHISSASVYAEPERTGIREGDATGPNALSGLYGVSKLAAEMVIADLARSGLKATVLRPSSIYGPGLAEGKMIPKFLRTARDGGTISLTPPIDDRVDLVFSGDVAAAAVAALDAGACGVFNIGSAKMSRIAEIADACVRAQERGRVTYPDETAGSDPVSRFGLDVTAARESFGFQAGTALEDGLRAMLEDIAQGKAAS